MKRQLFYGTWSVLLHTRVRTVQILEYGTGETPSDTRIISSAYLLHSSFLTILTIYRTV